MRHGKAPVAHHGLPYLAFALGFIFPCAQRCFSSRDIICEQELADVIVQHRLPQRVTGMRFAE